jgi:hypothetical protein
MRRASRGREPPEIAPLAPAFSGGLRPRLAGSDQWVARMVIPMRAGAMPGAGR